MRRKAALLRVIGRHQEAAPVSAELVEPGNRIFIAVVRILRKLQIVFEALERHHLFRDIRRANFHHLDCCRQDHARQTEPANAGLEEVHVLGGRTAADYAI